MLTALYAVAVFRIRMPLALVPAAVIVGAYVLAVGPRTTTGRLNFDVLLLVAVLVVGMIGVIVLERASRESFRQRRTIEAQREQVAREQAKSDALLRTILPTGIVDRLRERREAVADAPRGDDARSSRTSSGSRRWRSGSGRSGRRPSSTGS